MQEYTLEWAEMLSFSKLKGTIEDPNYVFAIDLIRSACDHSFDIASNANCRVTVRPMVICQLKPLEWSYLYQCIKLSKKGLLYLSSRQHRSFRRREASLCLVQQKN